MAAAAAAPAVSDAPGSSPSPDAVWRQRLGGDVQVQESADGIPNLWVPRERLLQVMRSLKPDYPMLFDLSAVDERARTQRNGLPDSDFTVFYHLLSLNGKGDVRVKVALPEADGNLPSPDSGLAGRQLVRTRSLRHVRPQL